MPAMSDAPLRNHEWFWDAGDDHKIYPLKSLIKMYYGSVGHNSTLIVGLTPDNRGLMPDADAKRCREWGDAIKNIFSNCTAQTKGRGNLVSINMDKPVGFDHIVLQEEISKGERVREYVVEALQAGVWVKVVDGTCIGHKRIVRLLKPVTASAVRLRITDSIAPPIIKDFALYDAP
jgi:alpha-L-fucosidase